MSDLPVFPKLPEALRPRARAGLSFALPRLTIWHGFGLTVLLLICASVAQAANPAPLQKSILATLVQWTPLLLRGFLLNIEISFLSMAMGTVLGIALGLGLVAQTKTLRQVSWALTQFFRNAPWLALLFFMIYLLPYHMRIGGLQISLPDWLKAVIGLGLPVMANVAEIVRGGVRSIHPGQWEASESLGFTRNQQLFSIILPQAFKRMLPPWMNLYAILTTNTTLASIVWVNDVVTRAGQVLAAAGNNPGLLAPVYAYVLLLFFIYTYPVAIATRRLERRTKVRI